MCLKITFRKTGLKSYFLLRKLSVLIVRLCLKLKFVDNQKGRCLMRNLKVLLTSGLVIGTCLFSVLPAMAATTAPVAPTANPNATYWTQIKALRQTDKGLGDTLHGLRQSIQAQRKADWSQKSYTSLLNAKNDQISMISDYTTALTDRLTMRKDIIQLDIDRHAKNETNISTDLQNIITDLNNQISARNLLITDAQKILVDLGGSATSTSTTTVK